MTYEEIIAKALAGRSVNRAAGDWGLTQATLNNYVLGRRVPDYQTAILLADASGCDLASVMKACAVKELELKPHEFFKKFLKIRTGAKSDSEASTLYVMSNALRQFLRRTTDTLRLAPPQATTP